jgi:hypothetical protein
METTETIYEYPHKHYFVSVIGPFLLLAVLLLISVARSLQGTATLLDELALIVVPVVLVVNVLGVSQPRKILDSDHSIVFEGLARRHEFAWRDVAVVKLKEFAFTDRIYLRVSRFSPLGGRYWFDANKYENFEELRQKLRRKEVELHPERARYQKRDMKPKEVKAG